MNQELRKVLMELLRDFPITMEGMSTVAMSDLLSNNLNLEKENNIRSCIPLRTRNYKMVWRIQKRETQKGKPQNLKQFYKEFKD